MNRVALAVGGVLMILVVVLSMLAAMVAGFPTLLPFAPFFFMAALMVGNLLFIVAAVVHVLVRPDLTGVQRIVWLLISVFVVPIVAVGALVYFALGRARTHELFRDVSVGGAPQPPSP